MLTYRALAILSIFLSFGVFLVRGPIRASTTRGGDFGTPYVAALRMLHGQNPYACCGTFEHEWRSAGVASDSIMDASGQHPIYPPSALILLLPLALLRWNSAYFLYTAFCSVATLWVIYRFAEQVGTDWLDIRRLYMVAFALALAPIHTAIALGNLSALTFALCSLSLLLALEESDLPAGALLGITLCIKPSAGIALLIYLLLLRRWKILISLMAVVAGIAGSSLLVMRSFDRVWIADYKRNVDFVFGAGGAASYQMDYANSINLQNPLFSLFHSAAAAEALTWVFTITVASLWLIGYFRSSSQRQWNWLSAAFWAMLTLLPVYQRNYTGGAVIVLLVWAFNCYEQAVAKAAIASCLPFLVPGSHILYAWAHLDSAPAFERTDLYRTFVICHITWIIVALTLLALVVMKNSSKRPTLSR